MILPSIFRISLDALKANKLRTSLTVLGVIIGVTSMMTIISAIEGVGTMIEKQLNTLGPSTFMVGRMLIVLGDEQFEEKRKRRPITLSDAELIKESCEACDKVSVRVFNRQTIKYGDESMRRVGVLGGESSLIDIVDFQVATGRFHTQEDDLHRRRVVLIGADVKENLFRDEEPIGKFLRIGGEKFEVIGTAKARGSFMGQSHDNFVVIPLSRFVRQFGLHANSDVFITAKAKSVERLEEAMDQTRIVLRTRRHVPYNKPDDFDVLTAESALEQLNTFTQMTRFVLIGISSIAMLVGGIVVMNIMMVSVTERTREIGIRKALGATRGNIGTQFVIESLLQTLFGGIVGVGLGFLVAYVLMSQVGMEIDPSMLAIWSGVFVSTATGLISGLYPAMRAARLDPVKALGYE